MHHIKNDFIEYLVMHHAKILTPNAILYHPCEQQKPITACAAAQGDITACAAAQGDIA